MYKRLFDACFSLTFLILFGWLLLAVWVVSALSTGSNGIFLQKRIGRFGQPFTIYKFRTIHIATGTTNKMSSFLRKSKLDELPQLLNVLRGEMSVVGPRPDVPGYYDKLQGEERKILNLRPGITSLASIKYSNEEKLLDQQQNPLQYNDDVIFPDKVRMNLEYYYNQSFWLDFRIICKTIFR